MHAYINACNYLCDLGGERDDLAVELLLARRRPVIALNICLSKKNERQVTQTLYVYKINESTYTYSTLLLSVTSFRRFSICAIFAREPPQESVKIVQVKQVN